MSYEYLSMVFFVVRAPTREGGKKKKKKVTEPRAVPMWQGGTTITSVGLNTAMMK